MWMATRTHWHVWKVADGNTAAFLSRAYTSRSAANAHAKQYAGKQYRIVWQCQFDCCPKPPQEKLADD